MKEDSNRATLLWVVFFCAGVVWFLAGVFAHDLYTGDVKRSVWLEAVERGFAKEIVTSEGEAFVWVEARP